MPWVEPRQVEQDLIISRAIVALFTDPFLAGELRFRGGTALNKAARLTATAARAAFTSVFSRLIAQLPGAPWNRTPEMAERFGIEVHAD